MGESNRGRKTERRENRASKPRKSMAELSGLCSKESWGKGSEAPGLGLGWFRVGAGCAIRMTV